MKQYKVAVLGATGAVGREMMKILAERKFPLAELRCLASERSAGGKIDFCGESLTVQKLSEDSFKGIDIVLGAAPASLAREYAPHITAAGAVFVDNSSAFRMNPEVPLVIPEINPGDALLHKGIIANPNCSTIITLMAVNAINRISPIKEMYAATYQAVSGAGAAGLSELIEQTDEASRGEKPTVKKFQYQIIYNLIPHIGDFCENGYTTEEMKMQNETRKIMHLPELRATCTCVRVPVLRSHSIAVTVVTEKKITATQAREAIAAAAGCRLCDEPEKRVYPMPLLSSDTDTVLVGRIREDICRENGISLFCCGDQIRKGAATNTVQIAELLI